jgi:hypothetical protein
VLIRAIQNRLEPRPVPVRTRTDWAFVPWGPGQPASLADQPVTAGSPPIIAAPGGTERAGARKGWPPWGALVGLIGILALALLGTAVAHPSFPSSALEQEAPQQQGDVSERSLPSGWKEYGVEVAGFSIALPPGWRTKPPTRGSEFHAWDMAAPDFAADVDVFKTPLTPGLSPEDVIEASLEEYERALGLRPEVRTVALPAGPAREIRFSSEAPTADGTTIKMEITVYLIVANDAGFEIFLRAPATDQARYAGTFLQIAQSFRLTD